MLVVAVLSCGSALGLAGSEQKPGAPKEPPNAMSINEIMVAAHVRDIQGKGNRSSRRNLDTRVLSGTATDQEKTRLLELYRQLGKSTPPRGSIGEWKADTTPLIRAMEGVVSGRRNARDQLTKVLDCKACHARYRVGFAPGLSNLTDLEYYDRLAVDQVWIRSGIALPPRRLVELAGKIKKAGGEPINEQLARGWSMLVDFPKRASDEAMGVLCGARDVAEIRILDGGVSDKGLANLRDLPDLRVLVINSAEITDEGMKVVGTLKKLRTLEIMKGHITGKGLAELARLAELKELHLHATKVGDEDLTPLKGMLRLQRLSLPPTVSQAAADRLGRAVPGTIIVHESGQ
jgi:hypothetical protein